MVGARVVSRRRIVCTVPGHPVDSAGSGGGFKCTVMKPPPPVTVTLRRSRFAYAAIVLAYGATAAWLALLPLPMVLRGAGLFCVLLASGWAVRGLVGQAGRIVSVGLDRAIVVKLDDGRERRGTVLGGSYVGSWLTTIIWQPDSARVPRALVVVPGAVEPESFRQLRVVLLHGSPRSVAGGTSGVDAG